VSQPRCLDPALLSLVVVRQDNDRTFATAALYRRTSRLRIGFLLVEPWQNTDSGLAATALAAHRREPQGKPRTQDVVSIEPDTPRSLPCGHVMLRPKQRGSGTIGCFRWQSVWLRPTDPPGILAPNDVSAGPVCSGNKRQLNPSLGRSARTQPVAPEPMTTMSNPLMFIAPNRPWR